MVVSSRKTVDHTLGFYSRQIPVLGEHTGAFHLLTNSPKGRTGKWARGHRDGSLKKVLKLPQVIKGTWRGGRVQLSVAPCQQTPRLPKQRAAPRERSPGSLM